MANNVRPRLSSLTRVELLARAAEFRRMALTAATNEVLQSLLQLAERFEKMAEERSTDDSSARNDH